MKQSSISLLECVDIRVVNELHTELFRALNRVDEIILDAAGIERIDTAGLQLLLAFSRDAQLRNIPVKLQSVSCAMRESLEASGLDAAMRSSTT